MLFELNHLPASILDCEASELHERLPGPTLIHLPGRIREPLFITALAHGNEDTGWVAARELLRLHAGRELPRALSLLIGNVHAARENRRFLEGQLDFNRVWADSPENHDSPERSVAREVEQKMKARGVFAAVDIHNNTGQNPHYACVGSSDWRHLKLASLFSRRALLFHMPKGVQTLTFARLCPSVTIECGLPGQRYGAEHARDFLDACLRLNEIPDRPVHPDNLDLYRSIAIVSVPRGVTFSFDNDSSKTLNFPSEMDRLNFSELPKGTLLAKINAPDKASLSIVDEQGRDVAGQFVRMTKMEMRTARPVTPSMLTCKPEIVRQDCLGYLMETVSLNAPKPPTASMQTDGPALDG